MLLESEFLYSLHRARYDNRGKSPSATHRIAQKTVQARPLPSLLYNLDDRSQSPILQHAGRHKERAADEYSDTRENRQREISVLFGQSTADWDIGHCAALLSAKRILSSIVKLTTALWIL